MESTNGAGGENRARTSWVETRHAHQYATPAEFQNLDVPAGAAPAHRGFADRCVPVSPRHGIGNASWDRTRVSRFRAGRPFRWTKALEIGALLSSANRWPPRIKSGAGFRRNMRDWSGRVDSNHRSPASKAGGDGQTPLHPDEMAFPAGVEPAYRLVRSEVLIRLSYGKMAHASSPPPLTRSRCRALGARCDACRPKRLAIIRSSSSPQKTETINRVAAELRCSSRRCRWRSCPGVRRWRSEHRTVPILLRVTEPAAIPRRLELGQLAHVDAVAMAQGEKFSQFVFPRCALEVGHQAGAALADISFDTWDAPEPLEEGSFVIEVIEGDPSVHVGQHEGHISRFLIHDRPLAIFLIH